MTIRLALAIATFAASASAVGNAAAAVRVASFSIASINQYPGPWMQGPSLSGNVVAWARAGRTLEDWDLYAAEASSPESAPSLVARVRVPSTNNLRDAVHRVQLLASPTDLGFFEGADSYPSGGSITPAHFRRLVVGPAGGPLRTVASCSPGRDQCDLLCEQSLNAGPVVGLGANLAVVGDQCPSPLTWHVLDLTGQRAPVTFSGGEDRVEDDRVVVAGNLIAWRTHHDANTITVADATTGATVAQYVFPYFSGFDWDLQADGKVALSNVPGDGRAGWMQPGDPVVHMLPVIAGGAVHMADDRIAVTVSRPAPATTDLIVAGLDGSIHIVARFAGFHVVALQGGSSTDVAPDYQPAGSDFDGRRVVWSAVGCDRVVTFVGSIDDASEPVQSVGRCDVPRILTREVRVSKRGRFAVRLLCTGGCRGTIKVTSRVDPQVSVSKRFRLRAGPRPQAVVFTFGRRGRTEARLGPFELKLDATVEYAAGRIEFARRLIARAVAAQ
jgi:hypothetical protein